MNYARPKTRGELSDKLKAGIECEVVDSGTEMTQAMLDGWLGCSGTYRIRRSENDGYLIYFPIEEEVQ